MFLFEMEFTDRRIEPIPSLLQDVIERLVGMKVMTAKPDSCIIDVFNEVSCHVFTLYGFELLFIMQVGLNNVALVCRVIIRSHTCGHHGLAGLSLF